MSDPFRDKSAAAQPSIDLDQRFAAEYWTQEFDCTLKDLRTAIATTNGTVAAVTAHLKASTPKRLSDWWEIPSSGALADSTNLRTSEQPRPVPTGEAATLNAQVSGQLVRLDQRIVSLEKELAAIRHQVAQLPAEQRPLSDSLIALVEHTLALMITTRLEALDTLWK